MASHLLSAVYYEPPKIGPATHRVREQHTLKLKSATLRLTMCSHILVCRTGTFSLRHTMILQLLSTTNSKKVETEYWVWLTALSQSLHMSKYIGFKFTLKSDPINYDCRDAEKHVVARVFFFSFFIYLFIFNLLIYVQQVNYLLRRMGGDAPPDI